MVGLVRDKRGAVAIQIALMLPILIIILLGAYELWKVIYLQQVINDAAYLGVRYVSTQPLGVARQEDPTSPTVPDLAKKMVRRYVSQAPFVDPALKFNPDNGQLLQVWVTYHPARCGNPVVVGVGLQHTVGREWGLGSANEWLPFLGGRYTMMAEANGSVLCERDQDVSN